VYQHAPTPGAPGIYRHRVYLAELVRRGFHVDLVSTPLNYMTGDVPPRYRRRPYGREQIDGIDHHWVWASGRIHASKRRRVANYASFATAAAARALTLPRPDIVLVSSPPLTVGLVGPALARRHRAPWLLDVRDIWPESAAAVGWLAEGSAGYRIPPRLARRLTAAAAGVIVPTPGLVDGVRAHGAAGVEVVPGPVIDAASTDEERRAARARLGVDDGSCVFLYAGAVGIANGLEVLRDAVEAADRRLPIRVVIAGDGSARVELERRLAAGAAGRVQFLGPRPKDEVRALLAAADVCLHLLRPNPVFETAQPTKMLEYFGAHRPVITTVPGLPAELALASSGAFAGDAATLARELERWAAMSGEERRSRGEDAFTFGDGRFGVAAEVDHFEAILRRTIAAGR
jgi:glycosyltransferase involved in cell wall biosynthesis